MSGTKRRTTILINWAAAVTGCIQPDLLAATSNPNNGNPEGDTGNSANYRQINEFTIGSPYYTTPVGYFSQSESPYGTFDQGGNVWEWNEDSLESSMHRRRGGAYNADLYGLESTYRNYSDSAFENGAIGFRIASVPEPGSLMMIRG